MKKAYVLPHPPIILPEVGRGEEEKISKTIDAFDQVAREIAKIKPDTIIISSPHAPYYRDAFYMAKGQEAFGNLEAFGVRGVEESFLIDQDLSREILVTGKTLPIYYTDLEVDDLDHGSLIPLRLIKKYYKDFKIVRLGLSVLPAKLHFQLGKAVAKAVENLGRRVVYIGSGDLSHVLKEDGPYGYRPEGPDFDKKIVDILERGALDELFKISRLEADSAYQCGLGSFQIMAGFLDGEEITAKKYSYEGPFGVGYGVFSFSGENSEPGIDPYIELARSTIETYITSGKTLDLPESLPEEMKNSRAGTFVSLHKDGDLRGCIGTIGPTRENIGEEIIENAIAAATRDPRFPPVQVEELKDLEISVDVLEKPEPIRSLSDLDVKVYGVIVSSGLRKGLLLPNLEGIKTPEDQIFIALQKAGIHPDEDFDIERFKVIRHEYK